MPTDLPPLSQWASIDEPRRAVRLGLPKNYERYRRIVEDADYWQEGALWIGHRTGDKVVDAALRDRVKPQFISDDVLGECVENRTNGLVGQEADIRFELIDPPEGEGEALAQAEQAAKDEADAMLATLSAWWDRVRYWEQVAHACDRTSYAGRGSVYPYIAEGNLVTLPPDGTVPARQMNPTGKTPAEAFDLVEVEAPKPHMATVYTDPTTGQRSAVILQRMNDRDQATVWMVDRVTGQTVVKVFGECQNTRQLSANLGGVVPFGEMRGRRLLNDPLVSEQSLLNFILTVTGRTVETAGFRERHVTNAEPPKLWLSAKPSTLPIIDVRKNTNGDEVAWAVEAPDVFGAGILSRHIGIELNKDRPDQPQDIKDPSVSVVEPADPTGTNNTADAVESRIYKRAKQGHLALDATVQASGTAYQQARNQHERDLHRLKGPCEGMIRDSLGGVLALAAQMSGEVRAFLGRFKLVVNLRVSAGPVTTQDVTDAITLRDNGAISTQTMRARVGVEDPEAERESIDSDPLAKADRWSKIAGAIQAMSLVPGWTAEGAAEVLGVSADDLALLKSGPKPPAQDQPGGNLKAVA